jgi:hypothetical protein
MFTSYGRNVAKWTKTWNRTDGEYFCEAVSMDDAQVTEYWTRIPKEMPRGSHEKGPDMIMGDGEPSKKPATKKATRAAESKPKKKTGRYQTNGQFCQSIQERSGEGSQDYEKG